MKERVTTKVTKLKPSLWGCRVLIDDIPTIEVRVKSLSDIQPAFKDMLRTLSKLGFDSDMADSSRYRENNRPTNCYKFIWLK